MTLLRRLAGVHRGALLALTVLMTLTAFLAAAAPAALTEAYDHAVRESVGGGADDLRVIGTTTGARPTAGLSTPEGLALQSAWWRDLLPPRLRAMTGPAEPSVTTTRLALASGVLELRWKPELDRKVRYVTGAAPRNGEGTAGPLQIGLARPVAAALNLGVGSVADLTADNDPKPIKVRVSGLYLPVNAAEPFWADSAGLVAPGPVVLGPGRIVTGGAAALDVAGYAALYDETNLPLRFTWRMPLSPDRLTEAGVSRLISDLDAYRIAVSGRTDVFPCEVTTNLGTLLKSFQSRLKVAQAALGLAIGGLAAVGAAALLLAGRLLGERMRAGLAIMRARGASLAQLTAHACALPLMAALPAAVVGFAAARIVLPGAAVPPSLIALLLVLAWALVPSFIEVRAMRRPPPDAGRESLAGRPTPRRVAAEVLVAALAVVGVVLARQRGADQGAGVDPLIAAVPVLLALTAGLIMLRCYPYPLRLAGRLARRGRSGVAFVALARVARQRPASLLPLVVLLLAMAVAGFTTTIGAGLERVQRDAAFHTVGADARVSREPLDPEALAALRRVPGVKAVVPARTINGVELRGADGRIRTRLTLVAIDLDAYRRVNDDIPVTSGALMSEAVPGPRTGAATLSWGSGAAVSVGVAKTITDFPTQAAGSEYMVIPFRLLPPAERSATTAFISGTGLRATALSAAVLNSLPPGAAEANLRGSVVETYGATYRELSDEPLTQVVRQGFRYALPAAAGYGALAIVLAIMLGAVSRGQAVGYLRLLGLSRKQVRVMTLVEGTPLIGCAILTGWGTGLLLTRLLGPALDLRPYTGGFARYPGLAVDAAGTSALLTALIVIIGAAMATDAAVNARRPLRGVLRTGEQR